MYKRQALILALVLSLVQAVVPLVGAHRNSSALMAVGPPAAQGQVFFLPFRFVRPTRALIPSDFSVPPPAPHTPHAPPPSYYPPPPPATYNETRTRRPHTWDARPAGGKK